jgi:hypothetical protein
MRNFVQILPYTIADYREQQQQATEQQQAAGVKKGIGKSYLTLRFN